MTRAISWLETAVQKWDQAQKLFVQVQPRLFVRWGRYYINKLVFASLLMYGIGMGGLMVALWYWPEPQHVPLVVSGFSSFLCTISFIVYTQQAFVYLLLNRSSVKGQSFPLYFFKLMVDLKQALLGISRDAPMSQRFLFQNNKWAGYFVTSAFEDMALKLTAEGLAFLPDHWEKNDHFQHFLNKHQNDPICEMSPIFAQNVEVFLNYVYQQKSRWDRQILKTLTQSVWARESWERLGALDQKAQLETTLQAGSNHSRIHRRL